MVPLQRQMVVGVVLTLAAKPPFPTKAIIRLISPQPLPSELLKLTDWLRTYYPAPFGQILALGLPAILTQQSRRANTTTQSTRSAEAMPELTAEQGAAVKAIASAYPRSVLLHGDTGTGKTRVYLELVGGQLQAGRSCIVLTPEIGLTPQLAQACSDAFPDQTVVIHSDLTSATRRRVWLRILETDRPLIVIGPRSALFAPLKNLGLLVIDEFHDSAYKQEQAPHYLASRVAAKLAGLHQAQLILGSATPLVSDYFLFREKHLPIVRMTEPAVKLAPGRASIHMIDLKKRELFSRSSWLSDALLKAIDEALKHQQQSLVFLNRRGTARLIVCQVCGWQALCPRCDLPLTYHADRHSAQCHTCGFTQSAPLSCTECGANDIIFRQIGTKALVTEIHRLFPDASVQRFDSDNKKTERLEAHYTLVKEGMVDILVGTQILGKGLDLPRLSVLGVVLADTGLSFPDYTSEERTFQLLSQVMGRIHRGHISGTAFIQSYQPRSPLLRAAINKDYASFYDQQLAERKQYGFPPYRFTLKLTCSRASPVTAKRASEELALRIRAQFNGIEVIGPTPAFIEKTNNRYRWQLGVKAAQRARLLEIIQTLPANWSYDIDPMNLL